MEANGLRPRDIRKVSEGTKLKIPRGTEVVEVKNAADRAAKRKELPPVEDGAYHFLRRGENVWSLARLYDVKAQDIMERNEFTDDDLYLLREGIPVVIPGIDKSKIKQAEPVRRSGFVHEVVKGENIWDIARAYQVSMAEIIAANDLSSDDAAALEEGAKLVIPGVEEDTGGGLRVNGKRSARERKAASEAQRLGLGTRKVARQLIRGEVDLQWVRAAGGTKRLAGTLRWPVVAGWFIGGYNLDKGGYHQGIDIAGRGGWNVRAAARGIVAYSGNELRGYGNMVIVVHPGGWVTLYAHNSVNFVVAGEKVPRGGVLAELGATGNASFPLLHFEFIFEGEVCDPTLLFRPGVRRRDGKLERIKHLLWRWPREKPEEIRCEPLRYVITGPRGSKSHRNRRSSGP
mgnify:CR=1 FL=1